MLIDFVNYYLVTINETFVTFPHDQRIFIL